jgi:hypothetical protein
VNERFFHCIKESGLRKRTAKVINSTHSKCLVALFNE